MDVEAIVRILDDVTAVDRVLLVDDTRGLKDALGPYFPYTVTYLSASVSDNVPHGALGSTKHGVVQKELSTGAPPGWWMSYSNSRTWQ